MPPWHEAPGWFRYEEMSLAVRPNYPRGDLILDPLFYTSSLFVEPLRRDIEQLLSTFNAHYTSTAPPRRVFSIFKEIWVSEGWNNLHLSVIEDLDRDAFTLTVFRLFLGKSLPVFFPPGSYECTDRMNAKEAIVMRVGALFGLYTTYYAQTDRGLRIQAQIPIPIGNALIQPQLIPV